MRPRLRAQQETATRSPLCDRATFWETGKGIALCGNSEARAARGNAHRTQFLTLRGSQHVADTMGVLATPDIAAAYNPLAALSWKVAGHVRRWSPNTTPTCCESRILYGRPFCRAAATGTSPLLVDLQVAMSCYVGSRALDVQRCTVARLW